MTLPYPITPLRPEDAAAYVHAHLVLLETTYAHLVGPDYARLRWAERDDRVAEVLADITETAEADAAGRDALRRHLVAHNARGTLVGIACAGSRLQSWEEEVLPGWTPPPTEWNLAHLYTMPGTQGTGLGQALLDAVLPGRHPAYLWVFAANSRAIRFYERNGFTDDGFHPSTGPSWGDVEMLRMVRHP